MTNDPVSNVCELWQKNAGEPQHFSPDDFQRQMNSFERKIARRNLREYIAAGFVIAVFGYYTWFFPTLLLRLGCALTIAGTIYVVYQLHRRASARQAPAEFAMRSCIEFHRGELSRQHEALRSVWSWYLLPFLPGMCVFLIGLNQFVMHVAQAAGHPYHAGVAALSFGVIGACIAAVFAAIWGLNRWAARKLQLQIDELDALTRDTQSTNSQSGPGR